MRLIATTIPRLEPRALSPGDGCTSMLTVVPVVGVEHARCTQGGIL